MAPPEETKPNAGGKADVVAKKVLDVARAVTYDPPAGRGMVC